ncbi:MAG: laminin G, partial [Imperialibacter sp.]
MMKKLIIAAHLLLLINCVWAQTESDPQTISTSTSVIGKPTSGSAATIDLHVGSPIHYGYTETADNNKVSLHFPYGVLYIKSTFDEALFEVSKGYFSDKILISWTIGQNEEAVTQIKIYRRLFNDSNTDDISGFTQIATLQRDAYQFEDSNVQGGKLYEYKVEAVGVSVISSKYLTYITGVGYRNPTGVVTGNVSFDGGSPVKDVVVRADPQGGTTVFGASLLFDGSQNLHVPMPKEELGGTDVTLQAWLKVNNSTPFTLFNLSEINDVPTVLEDLQVVVTREDTYLEVMASANGQDRSFKLEKYFPTGNVDGRGFDVLEPIGDLAPEFFHLSIVFKSGESPIFFLNGRRIDGDYLQSLHPETPDEEKPVITESGDLLFSPFLIIDVVIAKDLTGNVDEIRVWKTALDDVRIRTDFKRYLGGGEMHLVSYVRCDEQAGKYAYDISKVGFEFNKNHGEIISSDSRWSDLKPTSSQLGILGVTDENGNYIISAIPYTGSGESYNITPLYGVHEFEPSQQLVFIGAGSEIINKIDFRDISSFIFKGKVMFLTKGVFDPIAEVENVTPGSVSEGTYNEYRAIVNSNLQNLSKGENYFDDALEVLFETPKVFVEGANIYIDGEIVLDKDKRPVLSGQNGAFEISVPIGNHYIEVKKDKHYFTYSGRFPAARDDGNDLFEFFEHQESAVTFLDTTRVSLVGRVVGGTIESAKSIGFGAEGPLKETYNEGDPEEETVDISSINNIGQAEITLNYLPFGGTPGIGELEHIIYTNEETGEYRAELLPVSYTINQSGGLRIINNAGIQLLDANETVNLSQAKDPISSEYIDPDGATVNSEPYHFVKSFTYRSTPVLNVVSQSSDTEVLVVVDNADGTSSQVPISTDDFQYPVYTQGVDYAIVFETFEEYVNQDAGAGNEVFDRVPIVDGEFNITNNLALAKSERVEVDQDIQSISTYYFTAGLPSISAPFTRSIDIKYRVDGKDYDARNYETDGIILGGQSDGSQAFVTEAPEVPDIILRDPPGSNSFASIESGKSISFSEDASFVIGQTAGTKVQMKLGTKFAAGGGLAGPVIEAEAVNSITGGISLAVESTNGKTITKTYTFNETISTSDDPSFVGSDADLYIGNTKNYFYGSYDNVRVSSVQLGSDPSLVLTNANGESIYVSKQKAFYFSEEPSETFFIYSQRHILQTLIPELEGIIEGIELGNIDEATPGVLSKAQYEEQIRLWKKVIQDNERTKYLALSDRENYKERIKSNLEGEIEALDDYLVAIQTIGGVLTVGGVYAGALNVVPVGVQSLAAATEFINTKKGLLQQKVDFLEAEFVRNVSFDAGVGSYTNSSNISIDQTKSKA